MASNPENTTAPDDDLAGKMQDLSLEKSSYPETTRTTRRPVTSYFSDQESAESGYESSIAYTGSTSVCPRRCIYSKNLAEIHDRYWTLLRGETLYSGKMGITNFLIRVSSRILKNRSYLTMRRIQGSTRSEEIL